MRGLTNATAWCMETMQGQYSDTSLGVQGKKLLIHVRDNSTLKMEAGHSS
jgi:hypothetical protein